MTGTAQTIDTVRTLGESYKYGFVTEIESESAPPGLNEDTVRFIAAKKHEPQWLLEWRLEAFRRWQTMENPHWARLRIAPIDYQAATYYSAPKQKEGPRSLDEVDPELLRTYEKLGIPLRERAALAGVAVDAVFDSVSVATTFKAKLAELGIIFCSFGEAVQLHPELVRRYLGSVVPQGDNFFAALNSAVFSDGSFALRAARAALPDGAFNLFPHQRGQVRAVRAHPHRLRQGQLCELSRGLHRAAARREPAPRGRGRAGRAR